MTSQSVTFEIVGDVAVLSLNRPEVPDAEFAAQWQARAGHLARGPTAAYRHLKTAIKATFENNLDAQLAIEAQLQGACGQTADFTEGAAAFLQKRPPVFQGR